MEKHIILILYYIILRFYINPTYDRANLSTAIAYYDDQGFKPSAHDRSQAATNKIHRLYMSKLFPAWPWHLSGT